MPVVFAVAPRGFRDEELWIPLDLLSREFEVSVCSTRTGTATGSLLTRVEIRGTLAAVKEVPDALVVIGGEGAPAHLWNDGPLGRLVRRTAAAGGILAAICYGVVVLARQGVLSGRSATVYPSERARAEVLRGGGRLADLPVVRDGGVITARGPEASEGFALELVWVLRARAVGGERARAAPGRRRVPR